MFASGSHSTSPARRRGIEKIISDTTTAKTTDFMGTSLCSISTAGKYLGALIIVGLAGFACGSAHFLSRFLPLNSSDTPQAKDFMGAHEALEHAEHAGHAHGSKQMGVTMAILAVLIAVCAAMVGSQRQELMTTLLDQSWAHSSWVAAVVKDEMAVADMQKMRGQPNTPGNPAVARLIRMDADYTTESDLAKAWDDASDPLVDAHFDAAEGYEHAQLVAEVALIIASIAVLLSNR